MFVYFVIHNVTFLKFTEWHVMKRRIYIAFNNFPYDIQEEGGCGRNERLHGFPQV